MELEKIAKEIRDILFEKQKEFSLTFEEDKHKYTMIDTEGNLKSDFPSVSKVLKLFYEEFDSEGIAEYKSGGNPDEKERLLKEWAQAGTYSTNMGSRVHYLLETHTLTDFGIDKEVRQPIFECDAEQIVKGDSMVVAGKRYIDLIKQRGCVLLDTEIVLGHPELGYTGQPDKVWLVIGVSGELGLLITDWKTNKEKSFMVNKYTKNMKPPFQDLPDNALGHYKLQLPLYGKLLIKMLEGTKYEGTPLLGCIIVRLTDDREFIEYRVDKTTINTILNMDIKEKLKELKK